MIYNVYNNIIKDDTIFIIVWSGSITNEALKQDRIHLKFRF